MKDIVSDVKARYAAAAATLGMGDLSRMKTNTPERRAAIDYCADGYADAKEGKLAAIEAGDKAWQAECEAKQSACLGGLMMLFWGEASKMADKCKAVPGWAYEDFVSHLATCIDVACGYKAWRTKATSPEQCIRQAIGSRGAAAILYDSNLVKNLANVGADELDAPADGEDGVSKIDLQGEDDSMMKDDSAEALVQAQLNAGRIVEGIVLDVIAFGDSFDGGEFKSRKATAQLASLPKDYGKYFESRYSVGPEKLSAALQAIRSAKPRKIRDYLVKTLQAAASEQSRALLG